MKVRVALVILLSISWVSAQAPYPPSGYRPPGRQFSLPPRPTDNQGFGSGNQPQNQYVPPTNQYGPPTPPPTQYLPRLDPSDFRSNADSSNQQYDQNRQDSMNQQASVGNQQYGVPDQNQYDFADQNRQNSVNQQASAGDQQYGVPDQNRQQLDGNPQRFNQNRQQLEQNQQQLNENLQRYNQNRQQLDKNRQQLNENRQSFDQNRQQLNQNRQQLNENRQQFDQNRQQLYYKQETYLTQSKNVEQQGFIGQDQNQGFGASNGQPKSNPSERNYLAPAKQQLYDSPNPQSNDEDSSSENEQNLGANQNYLPPRRFPEPTTRRPEEPKEQDEPEDGEAQDPNVAIATAVAKGQYYLWQPDGRLQRVLYKTTQTDEDVRNNAYSAKLVYQAVQPITAPIYTYNAPLVRLS